MQGSTSPEPTAVLRGHTDMVNAVCFTESPQSPQHRMVCSGSADGELRLWNLETARSTVLPSAHDSSVLSVAFLQAHDAVISSGRDGLLKVWSIEQAQSSLTAECCTAVMQTHAHHFCNAAVDATLTHGDLVWTASLDASKVLGWDVRTPRAPVSIFAPDENDDNLGLSMHLKVHSGSSQLLVGYESGCIVGFDLRSNEPVQKKQLFADPVSAFDVDESGHVVAGSTGSQFCFFSLVDQDSAADFVELPKPGVGSVSIRPDEKIVAIGGWDSRVRVYDMKRRRALALLRFHEMGVYSVAFSQDNKTLVTGSKDHRIGLFELYPPKTKQTQPSAAARDARS